MTKPITSLTDSFRTLKDNLNQVSNNIGDPADLNTTADSDLVSAINELHALGASGADSSIGSLDDLLTTDRTNLVAAVNELDSSRINLSGLEDSFYAGANTSVAAALNNVKNTLWQGYRDVTEYGLQAGDSAYGDSNSAAIAVAINDGHALFFPPGDYYFSEQIRVHKSFQWKGVGNATLILPTLDFTDSSLVRFEYGTTDVANNDLPTGKFIDCHLEGFAFNAGGKANGTRSPVTSIRQCWYINWIHQSTFENCVFQNFNGTDSAYAIRLMAHNDRSNSGAAYNMNVRMRDMHLQNNANGIQNGGLAPTGYTDDTVTGTGDCNASQFESIRIGGWSPTDGDYTGLRHGKGFYFGQGYDNTLQGCNIEIQHVGIQNERYVNYAINGLTEQCNNSIIQQDSGHLTMLAMNTVPAPPVNNYHNQGHYSKRGWASNLALLGSPENLLIDGTFESNLYENAIWGGTVVGVDGGGNTAGATGRNVLHLPAQTNPDIRFIVKPNKKKLRGWHTVMWRAKNRTAGSTSTLFFFLTGSTYINSVGVSQGGSGIDTNLLEIGEFTFTAGRNSSNNLEDDWKIYMGSVYFDDEEIDGFNARALNNGAYVDWVALYEGTVPCIPQPSLEFDISLDVDWSSYGTNTQILDFQSGGTSAKPIHMLANFNMHESHYDSNGESLNAYVKIVNGTINSMNLGPANGQFGQMYNGYDFRDSADGSTPVGSPDGSRVYVDNATTMFFTTYGAAGKPNQKATVSFKLLPNETTI